MPAITVAGGRIQCLYVESVCDHGFKRRIYKLLSKKEDTWRRTLWHLRCRIRYSSEIAKASRGSGTGGLLRISDGNPNLLAANRNDNGRWLNAYYDKPDNEWNRDNGFAFVVSQLSSFLSHFLREFCLIICPDHPPRFLPISSSFIERLIYFLLS